MSELLARPLFAKRDATTNDLTECLSTADDASNQCARVVLTRLILWHSHLFRLLCGPPEQLPQRLETPYTLIKLHRNGRTPRELLRNALHLGLH